MSKGRSPLRLMTNYMRHASWTERLGMVLILGVTLFGLFQIGQGLFIKAKANIAHMLLQNTWTQAFESEPAFNKSSPHSLATSKRNLAQSKTQLGQRAVVLGGVSGEAMARTHGDHIETLPPKQARVSIIPALNVGDRITVTTMAGRTSTFEVTHLKNIDGSMSGINMDEVAQGLVLVTCLPFEAAQTEPLCFAVKAENKLPKAGPQIIKSIEQHL